MTLHGSEEADLRSMPPQKEISYWGHSFGGPVGVCVICARIAPSVPSLLPTRVGLGAWLTHATSVGTPLTGASDHGVSEAVYLNDPEGNGVEVYADRPASTWRWRDGLVAMSNGRLDLPELKSVATARPWRGAPEASTIGHVHLQVGAVDRAETFYRDALRLDVTARSPGALFYAVDGYHHHIATNAWNSPDAARREMPSTGLTELELRLPAPSAGVVVDPWGTPIRVSRHQVP